MEFALLADSELGNGVWTIIGVVAGYFFKWLSDRDKLRHDSTLKDQGHQIQALGERVTLQATRIGEQDNTITELRGKLEKSETANKECEERTRKLEVKVNQSVIALARRDDRDKKELRAEIDEKIKHAADSQAGTMKAPELPPLRTPDEPKAE